MTDVKITTGGKEYVERASNVIAEIFRDDPALRYMTISLGEEKRLEYLPRYINVLFVASSMNSGIFQEANDWSSVAVWMPPGKQIDHWTTIIPSGFLGAVMKLGLGSIKKMLLDFQFTADALKRKAMPNTKKFWYLFFIGTDARARGQGLASKLITEWQPRASQDGLPIWLEATTTHSRDVYARCGFKVVGELVLGEGTHDEKGFKRKGGAGVRLYGMVWWPSSDKTS